MLSYRIQITGKSRRSAITASVKSVLLRTLIRCPNPGTKIDRKTPSWRCLSAAVLFSIPDPDSFFNFIPAFVAGVIIAAVISGYFLYRLKRRYTRTQSFPDPFQEIISATPDAISLLDNQYRYLFVNKTYERLSGKKREQLIGKTVSDYLGEPFFREYVKPHFDRCLNGEIVQYTAWADFAAAGRQFVSVNYSPYHDPNGTITGIVANTRIITDQIRVKEILQDREAKLGALFDMVGIPIAMADSDGRLTEVNGHFCSMLGYERHEIIGKTNEDLTHPEDRTRTKSEIGHFRTGKISSARFENRYVRKEGYDVWLDLSLSAIRDGDMRLTGFVIAGSDITERKRLMNDLRESQRRLETLIRNLPGIAYRCRNDRDWTMEFISEGVYRLTGYDPESFISNHLRRFADLIHPDDRDVIWEAVQEAIRLKQPYTLNYRIFTAGGEIRWLWNQGRGIYGSSGTVLALEGYIGDITDRVTSQNAMIAGEQRFRAVIDASLDAIIGIDDKAQIVLFNPAAEKLFQFSDKEILNRPVSCLFRLMDDENVPETIEDWMNILTASGGYGNGMKEQIFIRKDGSHFIGELAVSDASYAQNRFMVASVRDITQSRQAEAEIRRNEELFRLLAENASDMISLYTEDLHWLYVSPSVERILGYQPAELTGESVMDYMHPEDKDRFAGHPDSIPCRNPQIANQVVRLRKHGGDYVWLEINTRAVQASDVSSARFVCIARDITERRKSDDAIRESESRLRAFLDANPNYILVLTPDFEIVYYNKSQLSAIGKPDMASVSGKHCYRVNRNLNAPCERCAPAIVKQTLKPVTIENVLPRPDGTCIYLECNAYPVFDNNGELIQIVEVDTDITSQRSAEEALRQSRDLLNSVEQIAKVGGWEYDTENQQMTWTDETFRIHGFEPGDLPVCSADHVQRSLECYDPDDRPAIINTFRKCAEDGTPYDLEFPFTDVKGRRKWIQTMGRPKYRGGKIAGVVGNVIDITERKRYEEALSLSEARNKAFLKALPDLIFIQNRDGVYTDCFYPESFPPAFPPDQFIGKSLSELPLPVDFINRSMDMIEKTFLSGDLQVFQYQMPDRFQDLSYFEARLVSVGNEEVMTIIRNITREKLSEIALRRSKEEWEMTFHSMPDMIAILDKDQKIIRANKVMNDLLGNHPEPLTGHHCFRCFHRTGEPPEFCPYKPMSADGIEHSEEVYVEHLHRYFWVTVTPMFDAEKQLNGCVHVARNITERKRHEIIMSARLRLITFSNNHSLEELLRATIEEAEKLTGSTIGFYHFYNAETRMVSLQAWSSNTMDLCSITDYTPDYSLDQAGVWVDCIHQGKPVIHNDYHALSHRKGVPEGHAAVSRMLSVPVIRQGKITAILGVGNKPADYSDADIDMVSSLADLAWDIALNKRAEKALKESEEYHRRIVETANEGIWSMNERFETTYVNDKMASMLGYKPDEMTGKKVHEFMVHDELPDHDWQMDKRASGQGGQYERCFLTKEGKRRWMIVSATAIRDDAGSFRGSFAMFTDITDKKDAENRIRLMAELLEITPASITVHDFDGRFLYFNRRTLEYHGYTEEEFRKLDLRKIDEPESAEMIQDRIRMLEESGESAFEVGHYRKDGSSIPLIVNARVTEWDNRKVVLSVAADISHQKQLEQALRTSEATLRSIFMAAPIGLGIVVNRVFSWVNDTMCLMTGYTAEELNGQRSRMVYENEEEFIRVGEVKYSQIRERGFGIVETQWKHKNGAMMDILLGLAVIDPEHPEQGAVFTALEITDRKRAENALRDSEEQLRRYSRELEANNEEVRQFAYIVSHDLQSPLINLKGYADELKNDFHSLMDQLQEVMNETRIPASVHKALSVYIPEALNFIDSSAMYMDRFIKKLLTLSRIGRREMMMETLNQNEIIRTVMDTMQLLINEKQAVIHVQPLQPVNADRLALEQIWSNLIRNALVYSHPERTCEIMIGSELIGDEIQMFITDNGRGINKEESEKIFMPFRRGKWTDVPGEGMGLAYVQTLVRRHGGKIWFEPNQDHGTAFYFTIPKTSERKIV